MSIRRIVPSSLLTLTALALAACSPVVLPAETESDAGTGTDGATDTDSGTDTEGESTSDTDGELPPSESGGEVPAACVDLQPRVLGVLEANCAKCHGAGTVAQAGIDYILDLEKLIATGKVVPGEPESSRIYLRMNDAVSPMPPKSEMQRPVASDTESVKKWIDECAGVQSCGDQEFIPMDTVLKQINADIASTVSVANRKFTRYFSFVHLHNAGWCTAEIEPFRQALSKLVNSLSQETMIKPPQAIDEQGLIFRIDLSDYLWNRAAATSKGSVYFPNDPVGKQFTDVWELIADQNPYTVEYLGEAAEDIKLLAESRVPIMQGDAFIDVASRSPLYYDILDIPLRSGKLRDSEEFNCDPDPNTTDCLEVQLGIDILANFAAEIVEDDGILARAGFRMSDVSDFNRVIERHEFNNANNRAFWISYDFSAQNNFQNISEHPLDFDFDGGEIIFNLPNGLQAYMLTDRDGNRLDEGPIEIVQDESQKDFLVRNGVSCMGCHIAGMIKANDDIREDLDAGQTGTTFSPIEKDQIRRIYPPRTEFDTLLEIDIGRFKSGLNAAGVSDSGDKEPVLTTFLEFDKNIALRRAGAEFGLKEAEMSQSVGDLSDDLRELTKVGGSVQRQDFTILYPESACILNVGCTRACPPIREDQGGGVLGATLECDLSSIDP
jgi:hypothetical protein